MSELPISDEAVEAAAEATYNDVEQPSYYMRRWEYMSARERADWIEPQQRAIQAFLQAEGFEVDDDNGHNSMCRLIGPWRPKPIPEQGTKPASTDREVEDDASSA